jgi:DNA-binding response OmpR family regulator
MLPDANGLDLVKKIRIKHPRIPIIFLTARKSDLDMILGLELGPMTMSQSLLIRGLS